MIIYLKKMVGYLSGSKTSCTCLVIFLHMIFTATWSFAECYITTPTHNTTLFSLFIYQANSTYSQDCICLFLSFCGSQTTLQIASASCRWYAGFVINHVLHDSNGGTVHVEASGSLSHKYSHFLSMLDLAFCDYSQV